MERKISDEQIDRIAKNLLNEFALDEEALDEIAESPRLWWSVKNRIETEKTRRENNWFFAFRPQVLAFGALALVICFGLATLLLNSKSDSNQPLAREDSLQNPAQEKVETTENLANLLPNDDFKNPESPKKSALNPVPAKVSVKNAVPRSKSAAKDQTAGLLMKQPDKTPRKEDLPKTVTEETKTDFIALSYAANTESGQIVRVKVPSSMMVSLGVATSVEKNSKLVSAEVVIGDDGLARAIRFIR